MNNWCTQRSVLFKCLIYFFVDKNTIWIVFIQILYMVLKTLICSCLLWITGNIVIRYIPCKEYISVIERTALPASSKHLPSQPLPPSPALSDSQVVGVYCRQSRERLGGQMFGRRSGVVSVLLLIYILVKFSPLLFKPILVLSTILTFFLY